MGGKYLLFLSSRSVKWEDSQFSQFVYFLRKVCSFFNYWMHNYVKQNITVNFIIQKLKSQHTSFKKYTNWAKLVYFSLVLREREEKKTNISHPSLQESVLLISKQWLLFTVHWSCCVIIDDNFGYMSTNYYARALLLYWLCTLDTTLMWGICYFCRL